MEGITIYIVTLMRVDNDNSTLINKDNSNNIVTYPYTNRERAEKCMKTLEREIDSLYSKNANQFQGVYIDLDEQHFELYLTESELY